MSAAISPRFVPRRWLRLPARSAQLRLTLMYSGLFLLFGTAIIAVIFVLVQAGGGIHASQSVALPASPDTHVVVAQQHSADQARLLAVSWLALAVSAVASAPLGWFAAGRVLRPLRNMTAGVRAISAGNLDRRLAMSGPDDEFKQLGDTFDALLARLEASFSAQRRFVANAAHELRTPLTLERTLLQVALANPDASAATLRATCQELLASGRNQERLLEGLLTLATSERGLERAELLDLAALAERLLERTQADRERRQLELKSILAPAFTRGDPALLERLIANLLDNAIDHNREQGWVGIETMIESRWAVLRVSNSGPTIESDQVERLFEPFHRGGGTRVEANGHCGLGLSIARAVVLAHGGEITATPEWAGGLEVTVRLPAAMPQPPA